MSANQNPLSAVFIKHLIQDPNIENIEAITIPARTPYLSTT